MAPAPAPCVMPTLLAPSCDPLPAWVSGPTARRVPAPIDVPRQTGAVSDLSTDLHFAHRLADEADRVSMRNFRSDELRLTTKGDGTPVAIADQLVEKAMLRLVLAERPEDSLVGEEIGEIPGLAARRWIFDGIDGTHNYGPRRTGWGTIVALVRDGQPAIGLVERARPRPAVVGRARLGRVGCPEHHRRGRLRRGRAPARVGHGGPRGRKGVHHPVEGRARGLAERRRRPVRAAHRSAQPVHRPRRRDGGRGAVRRVGDHARWDLGLRRDAGDRRGGGWEVLERVG